MISLNQFTIKKVSEKEGEANFEIGPLPKGYGNTLGNVLRRVLYSSIPGASITAIKIDGVSHEYSTLSGLSDDILTVLLSLKNVVIKSKTDDPVTLTIDVKGKKGGVEVKASDISKDPQIEVINNDYVITKLTNDKASFKASIVVERNVGYKFTDEEVRKELGMLPIDANFSPVKLVTYEIVPTRVGQETELDQLNLNVKTDGSMEPVDALAMAANIFQEMANHFAMSADSISTGEVMQLSNPLKDMKKEEVVAEKKSILVSKLGLSTRLTNALLRSGYNDLTQLEGFTEEELANIRGMGEKSLEELIKTLKKHEINLI